LTDDPIKLTTFKPGETEEIEINKDVLQAHKKQASENQRIFKEANVRVFDIIGSVGAGKTSLLENIAKRLNKKYRMLVVNGDLATTIDADRIRQHGVDVIQIQTGKQCHLDPTLIQKAISQVDLKEFDLIFIENVGNLICPSSYPLGGEKRIVMVSLSEGPYMVLKHPYTFTNADVIIINKIDLAEAMMVRPEQIEADVQKIKPGTPIFRTNARDGDGLNEFLSYLGLI
jgi:hydrogenase nickel incorporation protein HypB